MKNLNFIIMILFIGLPSCKKETLSTIPDIYWGEVSATKNGESWTGKVYAGRIRIESYGFFVTVDVYNGQEFMRERLILSKIPYLEQANTIHLVDTVLTDASYGTLVDDGDVVGDIYKVIEGESDNFVTITSYNEETKEVKGNFQVTFVFDETDTKSDPTAPDTIRFTSGEFHTKIIDNL